MWRYLEHTSLLLDGTYKALSNLDKSQIPLARQNLTSRSIRIRRDKEGKRRKISTTSNAKNIPYVTSKDGELPPGLLPYIMEGILPMLEVH